MKFIKKNIVSIIVFLFLVIWATFSTINYYKKYDPNISEKFYNSCLDDKEFYNKYQDSCESLKKYEHLNDDTYMSMYTILNLNELMSPIIYIMPVFIMIAAIWNNQKEINSNYLKNYLTRKNYKDYLKRFFKSSYKCFWILPCYIIYIFIMSYVISGHFDYTHAVDSSVATYEIQYLKMGILFIVLMVLNLAIHSLFYANLVMICAKKNKNIVLTILEAYMLWLGIEIIGEVVNSDLVKYGILNIKYSAIFNVMDLYSLFSKGNMWLTLLISSIYFIISAIITFIIYRNREKTFIDFEK